MATVICVLTAITLVILLIFRPSRAIILTLLVVVLLLVGGLHISTCQTNFHQASLVAFTVGRLVRETDFNTLWLWITRPRHLAQSDELFGTPLGHVTSTPNRPSLSVSSAQVGTTYGHDVVATEPLRPTHFREPSVDEEEMLPRSLV